MRRSNVGWAACLAGVLFLGACGDLKRDQNLLTAPSVSTLARPASAASPAAGTCATVSEINALVLAVFGSGSPNANSALGKVKNISQHVSKGRISTAQEHAFNLVEFVLDKAQDAQHPLPGSKADLVALVNTLFCYTGLSLTIADPANAWLVYPSDQPQTLISSDGGAGTQLPANPVSEPTLITADPIPDNFPPGTGPLDTRLDQYPGYYQFTSQSVNNAPLAKPVVVAVCPTGNIPAAVADRLRLGHQASFGFEITPPADASFLTCPTSSASASRVPEWMRALASLVVPKTLHASSLAIRGIGGTAGEFSPFASVDPELSLRGGLGGTAGEFLKTPTIDITAPSSTRAPLPASSRMLAAVTCPVVEGAVGSPLAPECRPGVVLVTYNGTVMRDVPVGWTIGLGGGSAAPETGAACGPFGPTASTTTNTGGKAGICWNLGPALGTNTVAATPGVGGDAPAGVTFAPSSMAFSATAVVVAPTASATGETVTYDAAAHPGGGTCSHGLTPVLSYDTGNGSAPVNAGSYTLTVTCGGGVGYSVQQATAAITISKAPTVLTLSCPASVPYTGTPRTPCSATLTLPGLGTIPFTPSYRNNVNVGTARAHAFYPAGTNNLASNELAVFFQIIQ